MATTRLACGGIFNNSVTAVFPTVCQLKLVDKSLRPAWPPSLYCCCCWRWWWWWWWRVYVTCCSILVGAPRDNVTYVDAPPSVRQLIRPGVIYQCPITTKHDDCTALRLDAEGSFTDSTRFDYLLWISKSISCSTTNLYNEYLLLYMERDVGPGPLWIIGQTSS